MIFRSQNEKAGSLPSHIAEKHMELPKSCLCLSYMNGGKEPRHLRNISNLKTQRLELTNSKRDLGTDEDITGNRWKGIQVGDWRQGFASRFVGGWLPHTVVQVVDCPNLGGTLHTEVCVDDVPEAAQFITKFGTLTHYVPLEVTIKEPLPVGHFWRADNRFVCFHSPQV